MQFKQTEEPFERICPENRANYLNYHLVIRHLLELLNDPRADELMEHFPTLKSREPQTKQEAVWKKICQELNWQ